MNPLDDESEPAGVRFPHDSIHDESFKFTIHAYLNFLLFLFYRLSMPMHRADETPYHRFPSYHYAFCC